jgi:1,2-diacylglycerol 3-beta-galactosyltransferase
VEQSGFGRYSKDPSEIAETVTRWLSSPDELKLMQQAAFAASRPNATLDIANDIAEMLYRHKRSQKL